MWRLEREGDGRRDGAIARREGGERARAGVLAREIDRERGVSVIPGANGRRNGRQDTGHSKALATQIKTEPIQLELLVHSLSLRSNNFGTHHYLIIIGISHCVAADI
jgi:hypothetical protein